MSKAKTQQLVSLSNLKSLENGKVEESPQLGWDNFGNVLEEKLKEEKEKLEASDRSDKGDSISKTVSLGEAVKYRICNSCKRPIGEENLGTHYPRCIEMKEKRQNNSDDNSPSISLKRKKNKNGAAVPVGEENGTPVESSRNSTPVSSTPALSASGVTKPKKKYKKSQTQKEKEAANAALNVSLSTEKKRKQQKIRGPVKTKGPVDVEKQCGVPLANGGYCARSLTCKTHSMGAKRAVAGRSAPYDVLLQQYQKRNQAKLAANNALAFQKKENEELYGQYGGDFGNQTEVGSQKFLDANEETHLVLEGVSKSYPIPLERNVLVPPRSRNKFLYMREAYANALISSGTNNSGASNSPSTDQTLANQAISGSLGGLQGRCALVNVDHKDPTQTYATIAGEPYQVRAPLKAIILTAQYNTAQQQMILMKQRQIRALQLQQQQQQQKRQQQQQQ